MTFLLSDLLNPVLAEEVIFLVASTCLCVCLSVCTLQAEPLGLKLGAHIEGHHTLDKFEGQGHRSKVKVTKVNNVKNPVFSLVSEKVVKGQGHTGQGQRS